MIAERSRGPRLPDWLLVGAMKAGTTSLVALLRTHPDLWIPPGKEVGFFDRDARYRRGLDWYARQFRRCPAGAAPGDATTAYLVVPAAAGRIAEVLPASVPLLVLLRDPVDRAYSHYWNLRRVGAVTTSFEEVLAVQDREPPSDPRHALVDRGRYVQQLCRFEEVVGRARLHVWLFDDLVRDHTQVADEVAAVLGVPPLGERWGALPRANPARRLVVPPIVRRGLQRITPRQARPMMNRLTTRPFSPEPMAPATRRSLAGRYRADNAALAAWLGRDLPGSWDR